MEQISIQRGDIVWFNFAEAEGHSIHKTRPALIVQNDRGNRFANKTIVAPIRHDTHKMLPIYVSVPKNIGGLVKDSVVDCGVLVTVHKKSLREKIGHLPVSFMRLVDQALAISLGLKIKP